MHEDCVGCKSIAVLCEELPARCVQVWPGMTYHHATGLHRWGHVNNRKPAATETRLSSSDCTYPTWVGE